jgi:ectoine hydroxylase-related dioxygenase (phytanoyl-CoA dioxygenase family)
MNELDTLSSYSFTKGRSSMAQVQQVDKNTDINTINEILEKDGCIVIKNILDEQELANLKGELNPLLEKTRNCQGDFYGYTTKRLSSLIARSKSCQHMAIYPLVLDVMDKFLLKGCTDYQLNLTQAIQIGPGEPQQMMHPDDPMFPFPHSNEYEKMINCMYAVDEFTNENGATLLVPGSHRWPRTGLLPERKPEAHEITQGAMPAGSVLIYFGSLLHCGGANKTTKPRTGLVISYSLGWLRQSENQYLAVSQEIARELPERLQRLLGYFVHQPNLGQIDGRDPIEFLLRTTPADALFQEHLPLTVQPFLDEHKANLKKAA